MLRDPQTTKPRSHFRPRGSQESITEQFPRKKKKKERKERKERKGGKKKGKEKKENVYVCQEVREIARNEGKLRPRSEEDPAWGDSVGWGGETRKRGREAGRDYSRR